MNRDEHLAIISSKHDELLAAEAAVNAARNSRNIAIRQATDAGVSRYAVAKLLGLAQTSVAKAARDVDPQDLLAN
jgi:hypothetical protein